ncbi:hypothetical protein COOONC_27475 [Cooperia oncophora]
MAMVSYKSSSFRRMRSFYSRYFGGDFGQYPQYGCRISSAARNPHHHSGILQSLLYGSICIRNAFKDSRRWSVRISVRWLQSVDGRNRGAQVQYFIAFYSKPFSLLVGKIDPELLREMQSVPNAIFSVLELFQEGKGGLSVLRTFRLLRILKLVRFMPALRYQLVVMLRTMDNVTVFFGLLVLFIFIFR